MSVDTTQLKASAQKLKNDARDLRVIKFCDEVLAWQPGQGGVAKSIPAALATPVSRLSGPCQVCEARRKAKALAMKRWRAKRV